LLAFGLVIFTGIFFILAGIAKMGNVTDYISKPVLRGFAFGLAVTIVFKQFVSMSGIHTDHGDLLRAAPELLQHFHEWNLPSIAVGGSALLLLIVFAQFKRLPSGLLVILLGILAENGCI
jgi:MFS superfamily sulfate permease-like transporter